MDALTIILRTLQRELERRASPIDGLDEAIAQTDRAVRGAMGGALHLISRIPEPTKAERIAQLAATHTTRQIAERVGVSDRHVRRVISRLRLGQGAS
ncbi:helix-turn-helix domain-containing protein [Leptothrix discophora]|uniref:Helix-turn-helix domain-containing protein n=1 Tax=Leptothrix discophora TaxID=89 RepID=A0ABT9G1L8_LEPDI|nr:helix-turn-helix domain-containing protein [Leptothrix discophora]MDP4300357.1 helix-turn-helix domain-containing protein [Leptothrix discophora]